MTPARKVVELTPALLRRMPLPRVGADADKESRGRALIVGGSRQVPGALLLAGVGALRAGAGKLQLATAAACAAPMGIAVPEAMVIGLAVNRHGEIAARAAATALRAHAAETDALLVGPGMADDLATHFLVRSLVRRLDGGATLVIDAGCLRALHDDEAVLAPLQGRAVLTPHAGEMASLLGIDKSDVEADPANVARLAADRFSAVVVLKGGESWIGAPDGSLYRFEGKAAGLATSGSGDVLAGVLAGLAARGAPALVAALTAVWAHGEAGRLLGRRIARVGFLARELLPEIPAILQRVAHP
jgi:ADP-dependent NAD(P)H-hydrate dehydratase